MYLPPHFAETRPEQLHRLVRANPLGALVTHGPDGLDANHLPFELDAEHGTAQQPGFHGVFMPSGRRRVQCGRKVTGESAAGRLLRVTV